MNNAIELMKTLTTNQENSVKQMPSINSNCETAFVKTPKWISHKKCSINPLNNKKGDNKSFEHAVALSMHKEMNSNKNRIDKIAPFLINFNFENINHPLEEKDYKTFEENNELIKLTVLKLVDGKDKLCIHYNEECNNKRNNKIVIILLGSNHYIYVTKPKLLHQYIEIN